METEIKESENEEIPLLEEIINVPATKEDRLKRFLAMVQPLQQGLRVELKVFKKVYADGDVGVGAEWVALEALE